MSKELDEVQASMSATYDDLKAGRISAKEAREKATQAEQIIKKERAKLRRTKKS